MLVQEEGAQEVPDLAPKQEEIEIDDYFTPETVQMRVGEHVQISGEVNGLQVAHLDGKLVFIERCKLSLQQIDCLNMMPTICKIVAVLQVDHNNGQIATKVAIENPIAENDSLNSLNSYIEQAMQTPEEV